MYRFRCRIALWVLRALILFLLIGVLAHAVYSMGGCDDGFKHPTTCSGIPDQLGTALFTVSFSTFAFSYWIGSWIALSAVVLELALWFTEKN